MSMRWQVKQRMEYIRKTISEKGRINREDIVKMYEVSIQTASSDIGSFRAIYPGILTYDMRAKTYILMPDIILSARNRYAKENDNDPFVHCNRFPIWSELTDDAKAPYILKAISGCEAQVEKQKGRGL